MKRWPVSNNRRAMKELFLLTILTLTAWFLSIRYGLFRLFHDHLEDISGEYTEAVYAMLTFLSTTLGVFSWFRYREAHRETTRHLTTKDKLLQAREALESSVKQKTDHLNEELERRTVLEQNLRNSQVAALNMMEDAEEDRSKTEKALQTLRHEMGERKKAEAMVHIQTAALTSTALGVMITDREGIITWTNPAFTTCTGYTAEEAIGKTPRILKSGKQDEAFYQNLWDTILGGDVWQGAIINRKKDESIYPEELSITPVSNAEGVITHFVSVRQDITERKKGEADKESLQIQFLQSQKMEAVGRLAGGIAHDFNNLLTSIIGFGGLALEALEDGHPVRADIEEMLHAGNSASQLTQQLLAFSRKEVVEPEVLNLNDMVGSMDKLLWRTLGEDVELVTVLTTDPGSIKADRGQLEQVIMNLAVNARDAMPKGGRLTLRTYRSHIDETDCRKYNGATPGDYVILSVSDSGIGIPEHVREHIFEPFFTTKGLQGTGLGLSTVYGIATQYGGVITVDSETGKGSEFKVCFPVIDGDAGLKAYSPDESVRGGSETILVVEDQDSVMRLTSRILKSLGYNTLEAHSPELAQDIVATTKNPIDMIITDVVMPGMAGPELIETLRKGETSFKVLFVTGFSDDKISYHGIETGHDHLLHKPYNRDMLGRKVREILDAPLV